MDVTEVIWCLLSAVAGSCFGAIIMGALSAAKIEELRKRLARLKAEELRRREDVARLNAQPDRHARWHGDFPAPGGDPASPDARVIRRL